MSEDLTRRSEHALTPEQTAHLGFARGIAQLQPKTLSELQTAVMELEEKLCNGLDNDAAEILGLGSEILETTKRNIAATHNNLDYVAGRSKQHIDATSARRDSILLQQHVTELVLRHINDPAKLDFLSKIYGTIDDMFVKYFISVESPLQDNGINLQRGLLGGIRGMVATALMFRSQGWEVKLPEPEWDYRYEGD